MASNITANKMIPQLDMFADAASSSEGPREGRLMRKQRGEATLSREEMARTLEESGNYRLPCKLSQRQIVPAKRRGFSQVGVIIDRETTGLNQKANHPIAFSFDDHGNIGEVHGVYGGLHGIGIGDMLCLP